MKFPLKDVQPGSLFYWYTGNLNTSIALLLSSIQEPIELFYDTVLIVDGTIHTTYWPPDYQLDVLTWSDK